MFNVNNETKQLLAEIIAQPELSRITDSQLDNATNRVHAEPALTWPEKETTLHAFNMIRRLKRENGQAGQDAWKSFQDQNEVLISDLQNTGDSNIVLRLIEILINFFQEIFETQTTGDGHCFIHALVGEAQGGQYEKANVSQYRERLYGILKKTIQRHLSHETLDAQEQAVLTEFLSYFEGVINILSASIRESVGGGFSTIDNMDPWVRDQNNYFLIPTELGSDDFCRLAQELAQTISSGSFGTDTDKAMGNDTIVNLIMQKEICETFVNQNLQALMIALARKEGSLGDQTVIIRQQTNRNSSTMIESYRSLNECTQSPINIELSDEHYARKDIVKAWRVRPQLFSSFTEQWNYDKRRPQTRQRQG